MRHWLWGLAIAIGVQTGLGTSSVAAQQSLPGYGDAFRQSPSSWDSLDYWQQKRARDFWTRTSPFFGDPYYDPLKTSPLSPFRSPQYHPWGASPFRGDPYYDPYANPYSNRNVYPYSRPYVRRHR